jgi:ATPase subunit of ABC transporter with duplicated ATPase domains
VVSHDRYFMDKIVDHLFILEVMVVEDFQETILILEPMKTVQRLHKRRKQSRKERLETKQPDWKFDFQRAKEYQK